MFKLYEMISRIIAKGMDISYESPDDNLSFMVLLTLWWSKNYPAIFMQIKCIVIQFKDCLMVVFLHIITKIC